MSVYEEIETSLSRCIVSLEEKKFNGGRMSEIQALVCNVTTQVRKLNSSVELIDADMQDIKARVIILEQ